MVFVFVALELHNLYTVNWERNFMYRCVLWWLNVTNCKGCWRKRPCFTLRLCPRIYIKGFRKDTEKLIQGSRESKPRFPRCESGLRHTMECRVACAFRYGRLSCLSGLCCPGRDESNIPLSFCVCGWVQTEVKSVTYCVHIAPQFDAREELLIAKHCSCF